jgi:hypothetical protein
MPTSGSDPQGGSEGRRREQPPGENRPPTSADPALLRSVLDQTFRRWRANEPVDPADMAALHEVARRHRGMPICLEPVTIDLVGAVLQNNFRKLVPDDRQWTDLVHQVASAIYEDPPSHERLRTLWADLGASLP